MTVQPREAMLVTSLISGLRFLGFFQSFSLGVDDSKPSILWRDAIFTTHAGQSRTTLFPETLRTSLSDFQAR